MSLDMRLPGRQGFQQDIASCNCKHTECICFQTQCAGLHQHARVGQEPLQERCMGQTDSWNGASYAAKTRPGAYTRCAKPDTEWQGPPGTLQELRFNAAWSLQHGPEVMCRALQMPRLGAPATAIEPPGSEGQDGYKAEPPAQGKRASKHFRTTKPSLNVADRQPL